MNSYTPSRDDKFSFGLWTVGWEGVDVFGTAVRAPLDPVTPWRSSPSSAPPRSRSTTTTWSRTTRPATQTLERFSKALADTGIVVEMATTNLFSHPVFKDGGLTANDRQVRRYALAKILRNVDLAAELGATTYVLWGGREGAESGGSKNVRSALDRYKESMDILCAYVREQGYNIRFALEPKPNEPRGDILLPTIGHAIAFINDLAAPRAGRHQPGGRARADGRPELRARHRPGAVAREAVPHRPERAARSAVRPGPALRRRQPARGVLDRRRPAGRRRPARLRRLRPLRLQAAADRGRGRRLGDRSGLYAQLPDPRGEGRRLPGRPGGCARRSPRRGSTELAEPTLAEGESLADLREARRTTGMRWPSAVSGSRSSTSWRWSTCSASASELALPDAGQSRRRVRQHPAAGPRAEDPPRNRWSAHLIRPMRSSA